MEARQKQVFTLKRMCFKTGMYLMGRKSKVDSFFFVCLVFFLSLLCGQTVTCKAYGHKEITGKVKVVKLGY